MIAISRPAGADLVPVPGFVASRFIPLVRHTLARCLDDAGRPGGDRVGMVLASVFGDTTTADEASEAVAAGVKPLPLLFYQSIPNTVLGHVSAEYGITGPVTCLAGGPDLYADAVETAELMLLDGCERVLLAYAELSPAPRARDTRAAEFFACPVVTGEECCVAVLVDRPVPVVTTDGPALHKFLALAEGLRS